MTAGTNQFSALASSTLPSLGGGPLHTSGFQNGGMGGLYGFQTGQTATQTAQTTPAQFQQLARSLQTPSQTAAATHTAAAAGPTQKQSFTSVDDMISHKQKSIMEKLVSSGIDKSRQSCDEAHARRMHQDWEKEKDLYLKEVVGDRRLGGSAATYIETPTNSNRLLVQSSNQQVHTKQILQNHILLVRQFNTNQDVMSILKEFIRTNTNDPPYSAAWGLAYALQRSQPHSPISRATATLSYLARQFHEHVDNRVRMANISLQTTGATTATTSYTGLARTAQSYAILTVGSHASHWATIFYCLRCGDFLAAKQVLEAHEPANQLLPVLEAFAKQQQNQAYLWDVLVSATTPSIQKGDVSFSDPHQEACWSLLTTSTLESSSSAMKTVEDFLYFSLWGCILGNEQPESALLTLGADIKGKGPEHFQSESSTTDSWAFTLPLLLTQQYQSALSHLSQSNGDLGIIQATHLGLFLPSVQDVGGPKQQDCILTTLIQQFSSKLDPLDALEYLVKIPSESKKRDKIASLVLKSKQFDKLGGTLSTTGVRNGANAALDRHFAAADVCAILEQAAMLANQQGNFRDALELLNLSEKYPALLSMLNNKLASIINDSPSNEKTFWLDASNQFYTWHFSDQRTYAIEVIEANNCLHLVDVFRTLLKLFSFFDKLRSHNFEEASILVSELYLFPMSPEELQSKGESYRRLDPVLKGVFPAVMLGAMDALYQQHVRAKHSGVLTNKSPESFKKKASLLLAFAGTLQLPLDIRSKMTNMNATMT